ncbi:MAG: histidinol-phosphatase HisJ family protein [Synergistaceae bacterium]|nr:histidinol-phosphatase HisJ family protein [Synergistaceae bacterium]
MTYYDSHVHSENSKDGVPSVDAICARAVSMGLSGVAITDHADVDMGQAELEVLKKLEDDVSAAREKYGGRLEISMGVELGEGNHVPALAEKITSRDSLDFVIGSMHRQREREDYYYLDYERENLDDLMRGYYRELREVVRGGCFDVVGHINYQVRYMSAATRARFDVSLYYDALREILEDVARAGKGIEINTSGLWRGVGFTIPTLEVVKMFRDAGGEIVTTGSDAHRTEHIGLRLGGALECLRAAGFRRYAFFKGREPFFHDV